MNRLEESVEVAKVHLADTQSALRVVKGERDEYRRRLGIEEPRFGGLEALLAVFVVTWSIIGLSSIRFMASSVNIWPVILTFICQRSLLRCKFVRLALVLRRRTWSGCFERPFFRMFNLSLRISMMVRPLLLPNLQS